MDKNIPPEKAFNIPVKRVNLLRKLDLYGKRPNPKVTKKIIKR